MTLFFTLLMTAVVCILLGCGVPTTANYIIMVTVAAPALGLLGVQPLVAHFFVFYYGVLADITPPVALAAYAGASMAGADPFKTGNTAFRLGLGKVLVPFVFVYGPAMLIVTPEFTWPELPVRHGRRDRRHHVPVGGLRRLWADADAGLGALAHRLGVPAHHRARSGDNPDRPCHGGPVVAVPASQARMPWCQSRLEDGRSRHGSRIREPEPFGGAPVVLGLVQRSTGGPNGRLPEAFGCGSSEPSAVPISRIRAQPAQGGVRQQVEKSVTQVTGPIARPAPAEGQGFRHPASGPDPDGPGRTGRAFCSEGARRAS